MHLSMAFGADVNFLVQNMYCICSRTNAQTRVVISLRLKELIDQEDWSGMCAEDLAEIHSLRELGFIVERPP